MCGIEGPTRHTAATKAPRAEESTKPLKSNVTPFDAVLAIISSESGIALQDLGDAQNFDDLGVDSLLSLLIISRIRDELEIELGNSILLELRNVGALRVYIDGLNLPPPTQDLVSLIKPTLPTTDLLWPSVLEIISQEAGIPTQDLLDDSHLADLGLDSLLSLIVTSRLQEELDIHIQHVSLFVACETIGDLRKSIMELSSQSSGRSDDEMVESASQTSSSRSSWPSSVASLPETPLEPPDVTDAVKAWPTTSENHAARSLTIQGMCKPSCTKQH